MQTVYRDHPDVAIEGTLADTSFKQTDSHVLQEEGGARGGLFVVRGTGDQDAVLPAAAADMDVTKLLGFIVHETTREQGRKQPPSSFQDQIAVPMPFGKGDMIGVLRRGRIHVRSETAFTAGAEVFIRVSGAGDKGAVRTDADTDAAVKLPSAVFLTSGNAGEIGVVEINLP